MSARYTSLHASGFPARPIHPVTRTIASALALASCLVLLPDAVFAATITVTTTADDLTPNDGSVSLREAIIAINAGNDLGDPDITAQNPGTFGTNDTVNFNIPGTGLKTISVGASAGASSLPLPTLTRIMTINGYSQPGAAANTLANADNAHLLIELDGANAGADADGLRLGSGSGGSGIRGLVINRFSANGIDVQTSNNLITGNFIGTNALGDAAEANQDDGIRIETSFNNTIGGTPPAARNIISGNNADGIHLLTTSLFVPAGTLIEGNFVGVNATGTGPVGFRPSDGTPAGNSLFGIEISGGYLNTVGGTAAGSRNVIGFNLDGIELDDGAHANSIEGNFVGVGADGVTPVGQELHGILLRSSGNLAPPFGPGDANEIPVSSNSIGGTAVGSGNLVEFNGSAGVAIFGNPPQNNAVQGQNSGNSILGNSIFMNGRSNPSTLVGIDLSHQFVYPSDDGATADTPGGHGAVGDPNNSQNFPVLQFPTFSGSQTMVGGSLSQGASPNTTFRIEFFSNTACSKSGFGEGQTFIGFQTVTTNAFGTASFAASLPLVAATASIAATATNTTADPSTPSGSVDVMNTSEFSHCVSDLIFRDGFQ